ncbi:hypothetical protein NYE69_30445 [Paenibacillus sp. FSL R5-0527]|uniref:hypothetical protein n=2 Tax=Paenibacillus TaxID=44249 RepID=UPI00097A9208|nr:hypothetical protein BK140_20150 [Paenibacillus macerans]
MQNRKLWSYSLVVIVCALLLLGLQRFKNEQSDLAGGGDPVSAGDSLQAAGGQLEKLLAIGTALTPDPYLVTVKWQGKWKTQLAEEEAAGALATRLGLSEPQAENVQGHTVYKANGSSEGVRLTLDVTAQSEGQYYVVLRLEGAGGTAGSAERMLDVQQLAGESLADEGVQIAWNAAVQGIGLARAGASTGTESKPAEREQSESEPSEPSESKLGTASESPPEVMGDLPSGAMGNSPPGVTGNSSSGVTSDSPRDAPSEPAPAPAGRTVSAVLAGLEQRIEDELGQKLERVEGFEDELTASQSYAVPGFPITAQSGKRQVALQLAVHRNADTGMDEIAVGSPLLTVEY